ncbi:DMT family transporter [Rhizobium alvei]|uniref:DMT family transporter n=1 Tax=Rhizobium alvei TaxID=1132659 RepID=A0ABT8YPK5_9HYPH|nr:DMT family transporter [Rhizobium alvei]MDO6965626.1 DMT family transporter [Rhizobium alvei]
MDKAGANTALSHERLGATLVFLSAVIWSFGGAIARFLTISDSWTIVFWRALFAGLFLLGFLLLRDGPRKTFALYRTMGIPGLLVAFGFATASTCFVIAISYTTVANVVLIQAGIPLIAALMAWILFRERIAPSTWIAIGAVIIGVAIMVLGAPLFSGGALSEPNTAAASTYPNAWIGNLLALTIAIVFAMTTVVTRRFPNVRQTPGASAGCFAAALFAASQAGSLSVTTGELGILFVFGALNLGLGMALFVTGARLIPSAFAALLGTAETVLGPVWVAIIHGEIPGIETMVGGGIVLAALIAYLASTLRKTAPALSGQQSQKA